MIRWLRMVVVGAFIAALCAMAGAVALIFVDNSRWITIELHPWLTRLVVHEQWDVWLPALLAGWAVATLAVILLGAWSMFYVWRRRRYENLIARLERELVHLRNLPLAEPAPLADLATDVDADLSRVVDGQHVSGRSVDIKADLRP